MARYSTARFAVPEAWEAKWARRMALFFLQLLILTVILHRFFDLATPAAVNLIIVSMAGMFIALVIAMISLMRIWFGGQSGAAQDFGAISIRPDFSLVELPAELPASTWDALRSTRISGKLIDLKRDEGPPSGRPAANRPDAKKPRHKKR